MGTEGLYHKYHVIKTDGTPVEGRQFFVLELETDPVARYALAAYAAATENTVLAKDLQVLLRELEEKGTDEDVPPRKRDATEHTPGLWQVGDDIGEPRVIYRGEGEGLDHPFEGISIFDADGNQIAIIPVDAYLGTSVEANLRLMAQAPTLLAALEYGAGAMDGPTFLDFVAWQLDERQMLSETAQALRLKAKQERAALAACQGKETKDDV